MKAILSAIMFILFPWLVLGALYVFGIVFQAFWNYDLQTVLIFMGTAGLGLILFAVLLLKGVNS
jgi:hypothetical protein